MNGSGGTRTLRAIAAVATVAGAMAVAPVADAAGPYAIDAHVDGIAGGGNYSPSRFSWTDPFEVTFTHTTDSSSVALLTAAQSHQDVGTAVVHETLMGTQVVTLALSGVHVEAVHEDGNVNDANGPSETVVLRFRKVTYTYQPVQPNGQKNGPPVTFTWQR
jgi:type VI protein secretion system component Hcp